ncbi:L-threonylcarbamoyladenylate synthase [Cyanobium sp. WAJ14-Wanaka]|uniref:L-threonylcarbamoyladenylate synthase n=1 Tax=Cyanobium sp. WAJ14-Wanaka TaxID=2823725 RepID=UPI0020CE7905|nr:L-threonylcarbamoyladenylate synthase [Cyanobium sp. WAJ14-Wanaka]MCP9775935.1 L-threonylcarbamoyladenylate synthase [Cyanobium sp. WAJ14-Wanaka]
MSPIPPGRLLEPELLAARLWAGEPALFPTDTLPALGVIPRRAALLWELKGRPAEKPLILMGASLEQLQEALEVPWRREWLAAAELGWPGALTLVLPAHGPVIEALNPGGSSLGVRVPACPQARRLLELSGPLATTSANPSGAEPASSPEEAAALFPQLPLLGPLPWPKATGQASTVIAWMDQSAGPPTGQLDGQIGSWQVLRAGAVLLPGI